MARPRQPAKVLKFKGSYDVNPGRERVDIEGTGELTAEPPEQLNKKYHDTWNYFYSVLPKMKFTRSDEPLLMHTVKLYFMLKKYDDYEDNFTRLHGPYLNCLMQLGLTPSMRAKLGTNDKGKAKNRFGDLKDAE